MITGLIYFTLTAAYMAVMITAWRGLGRLGGRLRADASPRVSVIIPARDEAENIGFCLGTLLKQDIPRDEYEIIVVDDHSRDQTRSVAQRCAEKFSNIEVLSAPDEDPRMAPKKAALHLGISRAQGEIVLTLDADCSPAAPWIRKMRAAFTPGVAAVAAWVLLPDEKNLRSQIEFLDMLALQLIGAAAIAWNRPFLANGANFAFRKSVYEAVNGYQGFADSGSGDDDLLLQKMHRRGKGRILFTADPDAAVTSFTNKSWTDFFQQRLRWSSKTAFYPLWVKLFEVGVFFYYTALLLALPLYLMLGYPLWMPLFFLAAKLGIDYLLLRRGMQLVKRPLRLPAFFCASLLHLAYIPVIGVLSLRGRFVWKKRLYRRGRVKRQR